MILNLSMHGKLQIERILLAFDFVRWDRYIEVGKLLRVYGWIDRKKDSYKDFVLLEFDLAEETCKLLATSSTDKRIHDKFKDRQRSLNKCMRVEYYFDVINSVRLK